MDCVLSFRMIRAAHRRLDLGAAGWPMARITLLQSQLTTRLSRACASSTTYGTTTPASRWGGRRIFLGGQPPGYSWTGIPLPALDLTLKKTPLPPGRSSTLIGTFQTGFGLT